MNLTTPERVKLILAEGVDAKAEALIVKLIESVSAWAEKYMRRTVASGTVTEYFDVKFPRTSVQLKAYPITSITTVHNSYDRTYDSTTLVDSDDYVVDPNTGILSFDYSLSTGVRALKVVYVGGMASTVDAFVSAYPDIARAVEAQVVHEFRRRKDSLDGGASSLGLGQASFPAEVAILNYTRSVLDLERLATFAT